MSVRAAAARRVSSAQRPRRLLCDFAVCEVGSAAGGHERFGFGVRHYSERDGDMFYYFLTTITFQNYIVRYNLKFDW